jgi:hypothetical protein
LIAILFVVSLVGRALLTVEPALDMVAIWSF